VSGRPATSWHSLARISRTATRNDREHDYAVPPHDRVADAVDTVELFLDATRPIVDGFPHARSVESVHAGHAKSFSIGCKPGWGRVVVFRGDWNRVFPLWAKFLKDEVVEADLAALRLEAQGDVAVEPDTFADWARILLRRQASSASSRCTTIPTTDETVRAPPSGSQCPG
jgi:hypothetical protein